MEAPRGVGGAVNRQDWPDIIRRIAELIGDELALELAQKEGGVERRTYIPKSTATEHRWAQVVGPDAWQLLVDEWGGERVTLPRGSRIGTEVKKIEILQLAEEGLACREIARRSGADERYVRRILAAVRPSEPGSMIETTRRRRARVPRAQIALPFDNDGR